MIENDVCHVLQAKVSRDGNRRQRQRAIHNCVNRNEPFDAAIQKEMRIVFQELRVVTVGDGQEEIPPLTEIPFNATDNR